MAFQHSPPPTEVDGLFSRGNFHDVTTPAHKLTVSINGLYHREYAPQLVNDRFHVLRFTRLHLLILCYILFSIGTDNRARLCSGYVLSFFSSKLCRYLGRRLPN